LDIGKFQASSIEGNWRRFDVIDGIGHSARFCCKNFILCAKLCGFEPDAVAGVGEMEVLLLLLLLLLLLVIDKF
jgi:hypothetical protein